MHNVHTPQMMMITMMSFRINVKDHSLDISFEEWRDYLLFHPSADLADIIASWRHNTVNPIENRFLLFLCYPKKRLFQCTVVYNIFFSWFYWFH